MTSPTQRTLAELRRRGYLAAVTEHWNPHARIRQDLWGFVDVLGLGRAPIYCPLPVIGSPIGVAIYESGAVGIVAIQACAGASHAARATKIRTHPNLPVVLAAGVVVEVWSWAKQGPRGKRKVWTLREERITGPA